MLHIDSLSMHDRNALVPVCIGKRSVDRSRERAPKQIDDLSEGDAFDLLKMYRIHPMNQSNYFR